MREPQPVAFPTLPPILHPSFHTIHRLTPLSHPLIASPCHGLRLQTRPTRRDGLQCLDTPDPPDPRRLHLILESPQWFDQRSSDHCREPLRSVGAAKLEAGDLTFGNSHPPSLHHTTVVHRPARHHHRHHHHRQRRQRVDDPSREHCPDASWIGCRKRRSHASGRCMIEERVCPRHDHFAPSLLQFSPPEASGRELSLPLRPMPRWACRTTPHQWKTSACDQLEPFMEWTPNSS